VVEIFSLDHIWEKGWPHRTYLMFEGSFLNEGSARLILIFGLTCEVAFDSINKKYLALAVDGTTGDGCFDRRTCILSL
jgi:hypothetical protein